MASYTNHLKLLKKDPVADGADTFNIDTMLNDNWDKVDEAVGKKANLGPDGKIPAEQLPEMDYEAPLKDAALKDDPADEDSFPLIDSEAGSITTRVLWSRVKELLGGLFVPLTRKINNKAHSADISLTASDVGAAAASHSHGWDAITGKPSAFPPSAHKHGAGDITSGTLGVARGGTGQTTLTPAVDTVALRASYAGTTDLTAGSSALTTGALYFVYE